MTVRYGPIMGRALRDLHWYDTIDLLVSHSWLSKDSFALSFTKRCKWVANHMTTRSPTGVAGKQHSVSRKLWYILRVEPQKQCIRLSLSKTNTPQLGTPRCLKKYRNDFYALISPHSVLRLRTLDHPPSHPLVETLRSCLVSPLNQQSPIS